MLTNKRKPSSAVSGRDVEVALIEEKLRGARDGNAARAVAAWPAELPPPRMRTGSPVSTVPPLSVLK